MRNRILVLGATVALAVAAACGDSNGPGGASTVALVIDGNMVDYDTADYGSEASELEHTLRSFGVQVIGVTAYDSATIDSILSGVQAFVIPEVGPIGDSLSVNGGLAVLRNWVTVDGGLLIVCPNSGNVAALDSLFGYTLVGAGGPNSGTTLDNAAASGTAFAGGPSFIWDNNGTYYTDATSLPAGADAVYTDAANVAVAVIPQGAGAVVLIGWDWYNAAPHGSQDGGWLEILKRALRS